MHAQTHIGVLLRVVYLMGISCYCSGRKGMGVLSLCSVYITACIVSHNRYYTKYARVLPYVYLKYGTIRKKLEDAMTR